MKIGETLDLGIYNRTEGYSGYYEHGSSENTAEKFLNFTNKLISMMEDGVYIINVYQSFDQTESGNGRILCLKRSLKMPSRLIIEVAGAKMITINSDDVENARCVEFSFTHEIVQGKQYGPTHTIDEFHFRMLSNGEDIETQITRQKNGTCQVSGFAEGDRIDIESITRIA